MMLFALFVAALGIYSYQKLPIDAVPDITNVQVQINTQAPGYSPLETEQRITFVVETALCVKGWVPLKFGDSKKLCSFVMHYSDFSTKILVVIIFLKAYVLHPETTQYSFLHFCRRSHHSRIETSLLGSRFGSTVSFRIDVQLAFFLAL